MCAARRTKRQRCRAFLEFAGGRPLAAHNAEFDMGFIAAACQRHGIPFPNASLDTLTLSQNLLPDLKKHTLDTVAGHLGLPEFRHHRASDDGVTVAHILRALFPRLREMGISRLDQINPAMPNLRGRSNARRQPKHIILLVQAQAGIRNLYKLVSLSHLEHFRKHPIIPKSLLMANREGLLIGSACENGEIFRAVLGHKSDAELRRLAAFTTFWRSSRCATTALWSTTAPYPATRSCARSTAASSSSARPWANLSSRRGTCTFSSGGRAAAPHPAGQQISGCRTVPSRSISRPRTRCSKNSTIWVPKRRARSSWTTRTKSQTCATRVAPLPTGLFTPKIENSVEDLKALVFGKAHALYGQTLPEIVARRIGRGTGRHPSAAATM